MIKLFLSWGGGDKSGKGLGFDTLVCPLGMAFDTVVHFLPLAFIQPAWYCKAVSISQNKTHNRNNCQLLGTNLEFPVFAANLVVSWPSAEISWIITVLQWKQCTIRHKIFIALGNCVLTNESVHTIKSIQFQFSISLFSGDIFSELSFPKSCLEYLKKIQTPLNSAAVYHKQQYYFQRYNIQAFTLPNWQRHTCTLL